MKYLKKFVAMLPALVFCLYLVAAQHDDGILDELTPVQQEQFVQLLDDLALSAKSVAAAMDEFTNHPEQESEMIEGLLNASAEYQAVGLRFYSHPAAHVRRSALPDGTIESFEKKIEVLAPAGERMTAELNRRRELDDYECDQEGYDRLIKMFQAISNDAGEESNCSAQKCFWCYCRNYWKMK